MAESPKSANVNRVEWAWRIGIVVDTPELRAEINSAIAGKGGTIVFDFSTPASSFEVANAVDREKPDLLFAELAHTSRSAAEWIVDVRRSEETPLVLAVHSTPDPGEMISALRAGASEFLSSPIKPSIYEAMDRIGALLESRRSAMMERGTIAGVLSAKGGCGATSFACHLGAALHLAANTRAGAPPRVLIADLDYQTPGASGVFRNDPRTHAGEAFDAVRRLSSSVWRDFVTSIPNGVDLLASPADVSTNPPAAPPEQWRVESLFRFVGRQYRWILVDLGRHLNPANWTLLQNVEELFVVTAPDVLALYQTRTILQTLSNRGFDKARIKIILNKNLSSPQDFWVESIEQMFEMSVFGVIPDDRANLEKLPRDRFEFPAESPFGRAIAKIAARMVRPPGTGSSRKAA